MPEPITVFSFIRCPFAMRVRMTLHEKGIAFETREEDLKNFSPALRKIHPEAKVPALVHGRVVLYESAIITEYLEDAFPEPVRLLPPTAALRAEVRLWTYWCNQIFKPQVDRVKYGESRFSKEECAAAPEKVYGHLAKFEARLSQFAWLVGDSFTLADLHVFPFARQLSKNTPPFDALAQFPAFNAWLEKITRRPSFEKTMTPV